MIDRSYKIHVSQSKLGACRQLNFTIDGNIIPLCRTISRYEFNEARRIRFILETELLSMANYFPPLEGALNLDAKFYIPHPRSKSNLEENLHHEYHIFKPNLLKLTQAIIELVHKIAFMDSCSVGKITVEKFTVLSGKDAKTQFIISEVK